MLSGRLGPDVSHPSLSVCVCKRFGFGICQTAEWPMCSLGIIMWWSEPRQPDARTVVQPQSVAVDSELGTGLILHKKLLGNCTSQTGMSTAKNSGSETP